MIYYFDIGKKYIGCRELKFGESVPINATVIEPIVSSGQQAHYIDGAWVVSEVPADSVVDTFIHTPSPEEIAEAEMKVLIAETLIELGVLA